MQRRDFLKIAGLAAASRGIEGQQPTSFLVPAGSRDVAKTEFNLEIAPITVELSPNRIISTVGYNGTSPGPLLRMKEGVPVTVNVVVLPEPLSRLALALTVATDVLALVPISAPV